MAENLSCGIAAHKKALNDKYNDELAKKFADEVGVKPRPRIQDFEINKKGFWIRQVNYFTKPFGSNPDDLKAEANRYRIYWAPLCNWSNRPVIARDILGLHDVISDIKVAHTGDSNVYGWGFPYEKDYKDPVTGAYFLAEFYKNADENFKGRFTTPTLVDVKTKKAVNNDYHRLTNYFEVQFRSLQPADAPDLYPVKYRKEIDDLNDWLFPHINDGHYRQAFATSPEGYLDGYNDFHKSLSKIDKRLATNRFLFGDYITDSDIRLYVSLVKWEADFYVGDVGPQKKRISGYKNRWGYVKELFSIPEFKRYTNLPSDEYNTSHQEPNFKSYLSRIASKIDYEKLWATDGKRRLLSSDPDNIYLRHPKGESVEDYQSEISKTQWNIDDVKVRSNKNYKLPIDASINPLKGILKND